jgi:hypothetical protein
VHFADLSSSALFTALLLSCVGWGLLIYGRKQRRWPQLVAGLALSVFPFFVTTALPMLGMAAGVVVALWWGVRAGF